MFLGRNDLVAQNTFWKSGGFERWLDSYRNKGCWSLKGEMVLVDEDSAWKVDKNTWIPLSKVSRSVRYFYLYCTGEVGVRVFSMCLKFARIDKESDDH